MAETLTPTLASSVKLSLESAVCVVQKRFLLQKFSKIFRTVGTPVFKKMEEFRALREGLDTKGISYQLEVNSLFDKVAGYIRKKEVITAITRVLDSLYKSASYGASGDYHKVIAPKLDARKFLSCYVISMFPEFSLTETREAIMTRKTGIAYDILILSSDLCQAVKSLSEATRPVRQFIRNVNAYSNAFTVFMAKDKIDRVNELVHRWYDLEKTKGEILTSTKYATDQSDTVIKHIDEQQAVTINFIKKTDPKFDVKILEQYKTLVDRFDQSMKQCYWDMLENDVASGKYEMLIKTLGEIKDELINLHGSAKKELDDQIDPDFIKQKLENKVMYFNDFMALADSILQRIIYLQAPARNTDTQTAWDTWKSKAEADITSCIDTTAYGSCYAKAVRDAIRFLLERIQEIKDDIIGVKVLMDLQS